ncbi:5186_t:CDS:2, partial [Funneliformis geosporum]
RAFLLKESLDEIIILERDLKEFTISSEEWELIKQLCCVLEIFNKATKHMSQSQYITLSSSIPIYNVLLDHLEKLLDVKSNNYCHYSEIRTAVKKGYEKLKKYYIKTDKSYVYPVAT